MLGLVFPLAAVGAITCLLALCLACFMCKLKRDAAHDRGYKVMDYGSIQKKANETCSVCLEAFTSRDSVAFCSCCHIFHKKCISKWLEEHVTCPLCLRPIRKETDNVCSVRSSSVTPVSSV